MHKGQTAAEYAMLLAAVAVLAFTALHAAGCNIELPVLRTVQDMRAQ